MSMNYLLLIIGSSGSGKSAITDHVNDYQEFYQLQLEREFDRISNALRTSNVLIECVVPVDEILIKRLIKENPKTMLRIAHMDRKENAKYM